MTTEQMKEQATLIEDIEKDAERYRFLRKDFSPMGLNIDGNHAWAYRRNATLKGPTLDAAIDAIIDAAIRYVPGYPESYVKSYAENYAAARVAEAVLQERERCARVCEELELEYPSSGEAGWYAATGDCAAAIREGSAGAGGES